MKTREKLILWASVLTGIISLLIMAGEKTPETSDAEYWTCKVIAFIFFAVSFFGIKSIEGKLPDE